MLIISFAIIVIPLYAYFIYPGILFLASMVKGYPSVDNEKKILKLPPVSLIVPIHNGQDILASKVENLRQINYPDEYLEKIIISDGSNDRTNALLNKIDPNEIKVIYLPKRVGKEVALHEAVKAASHDIVCFIDAGTSVNSNGLQYLCSHFEDSKIGAVSSVDHSDTGVAKLEQLHLKYVCSLRLLESIVTSSVGVSGSLFATRKRLFEKVPVSICSDLGISFQCVTDGYKAIVEKRTIGSYRKTESVRSEYHRKVRTIAHGLATLAQYKHLFNARKYGWYGVQLFSHKILRWISPLAFSLSMLIFLGYLFGQISWNLIGVVTLIFLLILVHPKMRQVILLNGRLFVAYNLAVFSAFKDFMIGKDYRIWEPTRRL
ncbi:glycosyltransferase [Marinobacter sp. F4216]|uniref:glycosyltransferase n=1 Tax=Marinobacter sp. F4216 TaxID=2874281 RepID=UPI001CBC5906|nr:glycosyltransferase [Marinobacter sp. F4216]MBZ2167856.1 glycosyltransferase [Marinobacter sp. F4216]